MSEPATPAEPAPAPVPPADPSPVIDEPTVAEPVRAAPAPQVETKPPPWNRQGMMLSFDVGVGTCTGPLCALIPLGGSGRLSLGYRKRRVGVLVSGVIGGANMRVEDFTNDEPPVDAPENGRGHVRSAGIDVALQVMPVLDRRFDPFLLAGLGYVTTVAFARAESEDIEYEFRTKRGGLRFATGWPFYVAPKVSMGPRVDVTLPLGGAVCERLQVGSDGDEECRSVKRLSRGLTKFGKRLFRRDLPKPWSVTWEVRFVF